MKLPNITGLVHLGKTIVLAHRPELLFGASVTATVGAVVLAAKGGYDARGIVDAEQAKQAEPLTTKQKANLTWLCYMPAAVTTITAVGSTTGLHIVHVKEKKALAQTALGVIEELKASAKEFERENLGILSDEEKSKILEERADNTPVGEDGRAHIQHSDGEIEELYLVRDARTGRDIWSNQHRIEGAMIDLHNALNGSGECDVNYFYSNAGYANTPDGFKFGWSGTLPSIDWTETVRDDGRPVRVFTFRPEPETGYDTTHR